MHSSKNSFLHFTFFTCLIASIISFQACAQVYLDSKDKFSLRFGKLISGEELKKKLTVLTSDSLGGRETGTEGAEKAARYIASNFKKNGLVPLVTQSGNQKSYFFPIPLKKWQPIDGKLTIGTLVLESGKDFIPVSRGGTLKQDFTENEFLIGIHSSRDSLHAEDFKNEDIENKVLIIIDEIPDTTLVSFSNNSQIYSYFRKINLNLKNLLTKKPRAIFISSPAMESVSSNPFYQNYLKTPVVGFDPTKVGKPVGIFLIQPKATFTVLSSLGLDLETLIKKPIHSPILQSQTLRLQIPLQIDNIAASDVIGYLPGSDLKSEVLVISAHYDHLGTHNGQIFPGADDDGSGTASLMTLADAFSEAKKKGKGPRRSVLFLANVGEEKGLLGSFYYSEHPLIPISQTITDLNVDMIGRIDKAHAQDSNYVYVIGSGKLSSDLQTISEKINQKFSHLNLDYTYDSPSDPNQFYYRSDHYNFARLGVPIIFYFNGVHEDYHQPSDKIEKINFGIYAQRARFIFYTAWDLANRDQKPRVDRKSDMANTR